MINITHAHTMYINLPLYINRHVQLSQSVSFGYLSKSTIKLQNALRAHPDYSMLLRDAYSFKECQKYFPETTLYLAPDMAFSIQKTFKYMEIQPLYDYVRIKRIDKESLGSTNDLQLPKNITYMTGDWYYWNVPHRQDMIELSYITHYTGKSPKALLTPHGIVSCI